MSEFILLVQVQIIKEIKKKMGQAGSKILSESSTTESSSSDSLNSNSEITQQQPRQSDLRPKKHSKTKKINATCFLKQSNLLNTKPSENIQSQPENIHESLIIWLKCTLKSKQTKVQTTTTDFENEEEKAWTVPSVFEVSTQSQAKTAKAHLFDIDRIDTLFQEKEFDSIEGFHEQSLTESFDQKVQKWKCSICSVMEKLEMTFSYRQGTLLICATMRLFLTENQTFLLLTLLLHKTESLYVSQEGYIEFSQKMENICSSSCSVLSKVLKEAELDYQYWYMGWVLSLFSSVLPPKFCVSLWILMVKSDSSASEIVSKFIFQVFKGVEAQVSQTDLKEFNEDTVERISELVRVNLAKEETIVRLQAEIQKA